MTTLPTICPCPDVPLALLDALAARQDVALVAPELRARALSGASPFRGVVLATDARALLALPSPLTMLADARPRWVLVSDALGVELPRLGALLRETDVVQRSNLASTADAVAQHAVRQHARNQAQPASGEPLAPMSLGAVSAAFRRSVAEATDAFAVELGEAVSAALSPAKDAIRATMGAPARASLQHLTASLHQIHLVAVSGLQSSSPLVPDPRRETDNS